MPKSTGDAGSRRTPGNAEQCQASVYHARQPRVAILGVKLNGTPKGMGKLEEGGQVVPVGVRDNAVVGGA